MTARDNGVYTARLNRIQLAMEHYFPRNAAVKMGYAVFFSADVSAAGYGWSGI